MTLLYLFCGATLAVSAAFDKGKTKQALKAGFKMLSNALPTFLALILFMVILLYFVPAENMASMMSTGNGILDMITATILGSIAVLPGFIVFPIAGILKDLGVSYLVLAGFTTSLMMVGIVTFPLEKKYFGHKFALYRNIAGYIIAIITTIVIAFVLEGGF